MLAIDANIVVRYLTGDDAKMSPAAFRLVSENAVFVPVTVVLETEWVLREVYDMSKDRVIGQLRKFLGLPTVTVADAENVARALNFGERGLDLADALHLAQSGNCDAFLSFDRKLVKRAQTLDAVEARLV